MPKYIKRALEPVIRRAAKQFPAIIVTGPRQSGKTTLLKHLFGASYRYVSLELPEWQAAATSDPHGFMSLYPPPVIFDELQYAPQLLPYIKEQIDAQRDKYGQYIISGSQNLLLLEQVTESLPGRAAILKLLPLSQREIVGSPNRPLPWEKRTYRKAAIKNINRTNLWKNFLRGGYPELVAHPQRDIQLWQSSYLQTYLERDIRSLRHVSDLITFQSFLRALAARSAQLLSLTDLSRDIGASVNTIKGWLSVLEATFQIIVLRPYFANIGKRLVKSPKVYFTDVGLLCHLVGLKDPEHAAAGPMAGAIFETAVLLEIEKTLLSCGVTPQCYFWRTSHGVEVDIVIDTGTNLIPIEVKLSSTPRPSMAANLLQFRDAFAKKVDTGYVVHTGNSLLPLAPGVVALPFAAL